MNLNRKWEQTSKKKKKDTAQKDETVDESADKDDAPYVTSDWTELIGSYQRPCRWSNLIKDITAELYTCTEDWTSLKVKPLILTHNYRHLDLCWWSYSKVKNSTMMTMFLSVLSCSLQGFIYSSTSLYFNVKTYIYIDKWLKSKLWRFE